MENYVCPRKQKVHAFLEPIIFLEFIRRLYGYKTVTMRSLCGSYSLDKWYHGHDGTDKFRQYIRLPSSGVKLYIVLLKSCYIAVI